MSLPPAVRRVPRVSVRRILLLLLAGLLPVILLATSSVVLASREVTRQVDDRVSATAATSSVVVGQQTAALATLVESYADGSSLSRELAAGPSGEARITTMLSHLTAAAGVGSSTFLSDVAGTVLYRNPPAPGVIGHNFAYRDWYKGLRATGRPYVSAATVSVLPGHPLVVAVVDYIRAADGHPSASSAPRTVSPRSRPTQRTWRRWQGSR